MGFRNANKNVVVTTQLPKPGYGLRIGFVVDFDYGNQNNVRIIEEGSIVYIGIDLSKEARCYLYKDYNISYEGYRALTSRYQPNTEMVADYQEWMKSRGRTPREATAASMTTNEFELTPMYDNIKKAIQVVEQNPVELSLSNGTFDKLKDRHLLPCVLFNYENNTFYRCSDQSATGFRSGWVRMSVNSAPDQMVTSVKNITLPRGAVKHTFYHDRTK